MNAHNISFVDVLYSILSGVYLKLNSVPLNDCSLKHHKQVLWKGVIIPNPMDL